jgi:hypothetical protein
MDDLLLQVIDKLTVKTNAGRVEWEDISSGLLNDRFRARVDEVAVEVTDGERKSDRLAEDGSEVYRTYYRMVLVNSQGRCLIACVQEEGEEQFGRLAQLFNAARSKALHTRTVLEKLLTTLSK